MIHLVDTSAWIEVLRDDGNAEVKAAVTRLVADGKARWCEMILIELWNGAGAGDDRRLQRLMPLVPILPVDEPTWTAAIALTKTARAHGVTVQATDLLIAACARRHGVKLLSLDRHFDRLAGL